jgi:hypothetical protein
VRGLLQEQTVDVVVHRPVELLVVRPRSSTEIVVPLTGRQRLEATGLAGDNTPLPDATMSWTAADTTVATVDPATGWVTGRSAGRTVVTVRAPGVGLTASWTVSVAGGALRLAQRRLGLALNERQVLRANFVDSAGAALASAVNLTWTSAQPGIAEVGADGTGCQYYVCRYPLIYVPQ